MKKIIKRFGKKQRLVSLAVLIVFFSGFVLSTFVLEKEIKADSLIGLDEGYGTIVNDNNGNAAGTITGATWKQENLCYSGKCLYFNGSDWISFGDDDDYDFTASTDFTIQFWFRHGPATTAEVIIQKYESTGADGGYRIQMESDGDISFGVDDANGGFADDNITSTEASYDDNRWHYVSAVKDGTTGTHLYIDSILVASDTSIGSTGTLANDDTFYIADSNGADDGDEYFGFLDEIKIYTTSARTEAEIKSDILNSTPDRGTSASFGPDQSWLTDGLVGYWKMDENTGTTVADASGNNHTATADDMNHTNGDSDTPSPIAAGKYGNSRNFDGIDDRVYLANTAALYTPVNNQWTMSAWVNPDNTSFNANILRNRSNYFIQCDRNNNNRLYTYFLGLTTPARTVDNACIAETWQLITVTFDGQIRRIFRNGQIIGEWAETGTLNYLSEWYFAIGSNDVGTAEFFDGKIDEVRLYNRALSPADAQSLYNWAPGPVGYWKFDEGIDQTANDSAGSSFTGTLFGNMTNEDWVSGKYGEALEFDGAGDYVRISDNAALNPKAITYSTWFKLLSIPANATKNIISKFDSSTNRSYMMYAYRSADGNTYSTYCTISTDGTTLYGTTQQNINPDTWNYSTCVYDGETVSHYLNGKFTNNNTTPSGDLYASPSDIFIAAFGDNTGNSTNADIDDIKIYSYARTPAQIVEDMNAGHPAPGSPVGSALVHFKFDEGYGDTVHNQNPSGVNGDLSGSSSCPASFCPTWSNSGKFGKALSINRTLRTTNGDPFVRLPNDAFDTLTEGTISLWFNVTEDGGQQLHRMFGMGENIGGIANNMAISYDQTNNRIRVAQVNDGSSALLFDNPNNSITPGNWYHIVFTVNSEGNALYLNGIKQKLTYTNGSASTNLWFDDLSEDTTAYTIGCLDDNASDNDCSFDTQIFNGSLDEFKLYSFALTSDQVKTEYNQGKAQVMGALSTASDGKTADFSSAREYCVPGDTTTCTPPIGHWKLDENSGTNVYDSSGNNNNGTITASPLWAPAKFGSGIQIDSVEGTDTSTAGVPDSTTLDSLTGSITLEAWATNTNTNCNGSDLVTKRRDSTVHFDFYCSSNNALGFQYYDNTATPHIYHSSSTHISSDDSWNHYAITFTYGTGSSAKLYINGTEVAGVWLTGNGNGAASTNNEDLNIGGRNDGQYGKWDGKIDDVRIYDYARTPAQITWDYNRGGPVTWYKFDETSWTNDCSTDTIFDSSPNALHADSCANGAGQTTPETGKNNNAMHFDDVDDYVARADTGALDLTSRLSISAWVKTDADEADNVIVSKGTSYELGINADGDVYWDGVGNAIDDGSARVVAGTWHHIVITNDDTTATFYVDGVKTNTASAGVDADNSTALYIGYDGTNYFDGLIDDVRIYNYTLTSIQVKTVYSNGAVNFK